MKKSVKLALSLLSVVASATLFADFSFADAGCSCPDKDALARPKCGPVAAKLRKAEPTAMSCLMNNPFAGQGFSPWFRSAMTANSDLKSREDVLNYMNCYKPESQDRFCHYKKTLAPIIELAAESSKLPFAVQACLFRQESDFSPTARNAKSGALGYIQFMKGTEDDVNPIIEGSVTKFTAAIKKAEAGIVRAKTLTKEAKNNKARLEAKRELNNQIALRAIAKGHLHARIAWEKYWEGTSNPPKSVSHVDSKCQNVAIAMSMVKQVYDLYLMEWKGVKLKETEDGARVNGMSVTDSSIFLAGGYNWGIYSFAPKCGDVRSLKQCRDRFPAGHETRNHMSAIENCASKNSWQPLSGNKSDRRDCSQARCESWNI